MLLFSADAKIFLKIFQIIYFAPETWKKHPQTILIICTHFFQYYQPAPNQPKISQNLIFCSIKMSPCATLIGSTVFSLYIISLISGALMFTVFSHKKIFFRSTKMQRSYRMDCGMHGNSVYRLDRQCCCCMTPIYSAQFRMLNQGQFYP